MTVPAKTREFRNALGAFVTGVTIVTTHDTGGAPVGNTANSFNSLSLDPPLILWSLGRKAYSLKTYLSCEHFAVNVLREGQEDVSRRFGKSLHDKWAGVDYELGETGCPILPDALAVFECKATDSFNGGDHVIFVGEVLSYRYDPAGKPLLFWRGDYWALRH